MRRTVFVVCLSIGLTGCAEFPDLDASVSAQGRAADFPALLPMDALLARANTPVRLDAGSGARLAARAAALHRRARLLRQIRLIDAQARRRMAAALARHGA
ncbi:MAG: hypothetical protein ACWA47_02415 [Brevirhabdus sp.]